MNLNRKYLDNFPISQEKHFCVSLKFRTCTYIFMTLRTDDTEKKTKWKKNIFSMLSLMSNILITESNKHSNITLENLIVYGEHKFPSTQPDCVYSILGRIKMNFSSGYYTYNQEMVFRFNTLYKYMRHVIFYECHIRNQIIFTAKYNADSSKVFT